MATQIKINDNEYATIYDTCKWYIGFDMMCYMDSYVNNRVVDTTYHLVRKGSLIATLRTLKPFMGGDDKMSATLTIAEDLVKPCNWYDYQVIQELLDAVNCDLYPTLLSDLEYMDKNAIWHFYNKYGNAIDTISRAEMDYRLRHYVDGIEFHKVKCK